MGRQLHLLRQSPLRAFLVLVPAFLVKVKLGVRAGHNAALKRQFNVQMLLLGRTQAAMCSTISCTQLKARCSSSVVPRSMHGQATKATAAVVQRAYSPLNHSRHSSICARETPKEPHCSASISMKEPGQADWRFSTGVQARSRARPEIAVQYEPQLEVEINEPSSEVLTVITAEGHQIPVSLFPGTTIGDMRKTVASSLATTPDQVRLAYQGRELPLSDDTELFIMKNNDDIVAAMKRPKAEQSEVNSTHAIPAEALQPADPGSATVPLKVYTMEGKVLKLGVAPGAMLISDIRAAVAAATGAIVSEVRLQYAGKELNHAYDHKPLELQTPPGTKPKEFVMHAMKRMQGGRFSDQQASSDPASVKFKPFGRLSGSTTPLQSAMVSAAPVTAPGAGRGPAGVQLAKQFRDLLKHPIPGVSAAPDDEDPLIWHVRLAGPEDSTYAGGWFDVDLKFSDRFPGCAPAVYFKTPIWHPNIPADVGEEQVCVYFEDKVCSAGCVLSALQLLLKHPNPNDPLNCECAEEMLHQPELYAAKAKQMTAEHASK